MAVKVIAAGNRLMGDDAVGIVIGEKLKNRLEDIDVIIGETDIEYCSSQIEDNDFLFIIDAAATGGKTGDISIFPIDEYTTYSRADTVHSIGLLELLKLYGIKVGGYIIAVEIEKAEMSLKLSTPIESKIDYLLKSIVNIIEKLIHV
jgi:hydrogenase maturation protease